MIERRPLRRRVVPFLFSCLIAACSGGGTDAGGNGTVSVSVTPTTLNVFQGATATATVNVTRDNYTAALTLTDSLTPSGVTVSFNPPVLSGSTLSSTLTVTATATATPGQVVVAVHADGPGADAAHAGVGVPISVLQPQVKVLLAGTGTGTVTSSPAGINCGSACTGTFAPGTSVTLTEAPGAASAFAGWSGGACSGTSTTCTFVLTSAPNINATFNSTAQSFSLSAPTVASVAQGGAATATATIARVNGYAGAVSITAAGLPSGVTVTAVPASTTDNTATLNVSATSAVAAGNYPATLSATGAGISGTQTATFNVQVTPAPGGSGNVAFSFANCDPSEMPVWFAAQNGTGAWTRVTAGANNTFTFPVGSAGGFAMVRPDGGGPGFSTSVFYGSQADITALALGSPCRGVNPSGGTKRLTGSIGASGAAAHAFVGIGGASIQHPAIQGAGFTLDGVPAGQRDLIAANFKNDANDINSITQVILRRDVNYASAIPALSLTATEALVPVNFRIATNNTGTDQTSVQVSLVTANGASAPYSTTVANAPSRIPFPGLPDAVLRPGDVHAIEFTATPASGGSSVRAAILLRHSATFDVDAVTFGPTLNQPTVTSLGTSPYLRLRAQLASQASYNVAAVAEFAQSANSLSVASTANYANGTPANWVLDIPDLTAAGYDPTWGLKTGSSVDWQVTAASGSVLVFFGATPVDGAGLVAGVVSSSSTAFSRFVPFKVW
jgi:hypothetical protein